MTIQEAAQRSGISARVLRRHCGKKLKATKHGRDWWIEPEDLAAFVRLERPPHRPQKT